MRRFLVDPLIGVADELESRFEEAVFEHSKNVMRRGVVISTSITFILLILWPLLALCEDVLSLSHFKVSHLPRKRLETANREPLIFFSPARPEHPPSHWAEDGRTPCIPFPS